MAECSCPYRTFVLPYNRECCEKILQRSFCCLGIAIELGLKTNKGNKSLLISPPQKKETASKQLRSDAVFKRL